MNTRSRTVPDLEGPNAPHWLGAKQGKVVVQVCQNCGQARYPYAALCASCHGAEASWKPIRLTGRVRSWCRFHQGYFPEFKDVLPYTVLLVRMDDGVDLFSNFESHAIHEIPGIGDRVEAVFEPTPDGASLLRFRRLPPGEEQDAKMKAVVVKSPGGTDALELVDVDVPRPDSDEVLIRIGAAGVCSHDIAMRKGILKRGIRLPFIPGHEISGTVVQVGKNVQRFKVGDRVATTQRRRVCGVCEYCRSGRETYCDSLVFLGHGMDCGGGYAEYVAVSAESACLVPEGVSMAEAAITCCAIGSSLNAVRDVGRVQPGETVLVTGASGGLGIHALQLIRLFGARALAVTSDPSKAGALRAAGAHEVIVYERGEDFSGKVRAATGQRGVNVVLDNVGTPVFNACRRCLAKEGRWVLIGELAGDFVPFNPAQLIHSGISLLSVHSATRQHLKDCLELLSSGKIRAILDCQLPLNDVSKAHDLMEKGRANGRVVLLP